MAGYPGKTFGPNDDTSRAMLAMILWRIEEKPVVNYAMQYEDVSQGTWYAEAVRWATSEKVVTGYGNGCFGPDDPITREQLAVMLWRYAGSPASSYGLDSFSDAAQISGWALEAMRWANENGIVNGYGDGTLNPAGNATRAEAAQMLKRFLENR